MRSDWRDHASCLNSDPEAFFSDDLDVLEATRDKFCRNCPVRRACLEDAARIEQGAVAADRHGLQGYLTAGQREAAEKRGTLRCQHCGATRDPVLLAQGIIQCPRRCAASRQYEHPPLPHAGDLWTKRHTTLGQRITSWVIDNTRQGEVLPTPTKMAELLGGVRRSDVLRVYTALVDDRTLSRDDQTYTRLASTGTLRRWFPAFLKPYDR